MALVAGGATATLAAVVMIAWVIRHDPLLQLRPDWVAMQFNTALGLLAVSLGLVAAARSWPRAAAVLAAVATAFGVATLAQYATGIDLGVDELIVAAHNTVGTSHPGRMSPTTALAMVLSGATLLSWVRRTHPQTVGALASVTIGLGAVALFGYAAGVPTAYGWGDATRMAVHTAAAFVTVGSGGLALAWSMPHPAASRSWFFVPAVLGGSAVMLGAGSAIARAGSSGIDAASVTGAVMAVALLGAGLAGGVVAWRAGRSLQADDAIVGGPERTFRGALSRHVTFALLLVSLVPLVALVAIIFVQQRAAIVDDVVVRLELLARVQESRLEELVKHALDEHELVANYPVLAATLQGGPSAPQAGDPDPVRTELAATMGVLLSQERHMLALHLFDDDGRLLMSTDAPIAAARELGAVGGSTRIELGTTHDGQLRVLTVGAVQAGSQGPKGTLVIEREPWQLLDVATDVTDMGRTGETMIAFRDPQGQARYVAPRRFRPEGHLAPVLMAETELPIDAALAGEDSTELEVSDYRGEPVLAVTRFVDGPDWGLVAKMDRAEALAPIDALVRSLALGGAITAVAAIVVAVLLGGAIGSAQRNQRASRQRLARLLEAAPVGIAFVGAEGTMDYANGRAEAILGLEAGGAVGCRYDDPSWHVTSVDGGPLPDDQLPVFQVLSTGRATTDVRHAIARADGTTVIVSVDAAPLTDEDDHVAGVVTVMSDISERMSAARARARLSAIVEQAEDAIFSLDLGAAVVSWNRAAERTFGYPPDEILGLAAEVLVPARERERFEGMRVEALTGQVRHQVRSVRLRRDGTEVPVASTLSPIRRDDDVIIGLSVIERDITQQLQDEQQLERYASELEQFAYVAAHDLQEPLRMVASFTELLARRYEGQLDADADEFIGYAVEGARRIKKSLNELLSYVAANTGEPFQPVDSRRLVDAAISSLRAEIHTAGATVEVDDLPVVVADERQLLRVFRELLSNAVTYHGGEPPHVALAAHRDREEWIFTVRDDGIGIEARHLDQLFGLFRRLHTRLEYPGTGLGLAICKKIVERHQGRIWIDSEVGRGTTVSFSLPTKRPSSEQEHHHD